MSNSKASNDGQNLERDVHLRYCVQSGQSSIHGDTLLEFQTQEAQSFAFYADKGEGKSGSGGPGTGKALLYTPGMSTEVLGTGLKTRNPGDNSELPAKIIRCKNGDVIVDCYNGNITLRGRNITLDANGGGQDGQFTVKAERLADIGAPDIRLQGEKITAKATKDMTIIAKGQFELKYGFMVAASFADANFGALTNNLKKTQLSTQRVL